MVRPTSPALPEMLDLWKSSDEGEAPQTDQAGG